MHDYLEPIEKYLALIRRLAWLVLTLSVVVHEENVLRSALSTTLPVVRTAVHVVPARDKGAYGAASWTAIVSSGARHVVHAFGR